MSIIISSQTAAATSELICVNSGESVTLTASAGIATGEDTVIQIKTEIDGWRASGEVISSVDSSVNLIGPVMARLSKPTSAAAYGLEITYKTNRLNQVLAQA